MSSTGSTRWGCPAWTPKRAGGRPGQISPDDEQFIVTTVNTRPTELEAALHPVEHPQTLRRQLLRKHEITFQRAKTWKESNDAQREAKLARIEYLMHHFRSKCSRSTSSGR